MITISGELLVQERFPDNTLHIKLPNEVDIPEIVWKYNGDEELFALISLVGKLHDENVKDIDLYMPYIPNARQDRVKDPEDIHTLKYFTKVINWLRFHEVRVLDPHSSVAPALLDRVREVSPANLIKRTVYNITNRIDTTTPLIAFYPDEGAMKRYSGMLDIPYCYGVKNRDWRTGKIIDLKVFGDTSLIHGNNVLIIDDICSRGGTFNWSAKKLLELGANKIFTYVSHCEDTIFEGEVLTGGLIERVFTTDSILRRHSDKIEVYKI